MRVAMAALWMIAAPVFAQTGDAASFVQEGVINAPPAEVWKVWSTSEGYKLVGVAKAEVDLRIGGLIRSRYSAQGELGDEETIENRILAFEPQRMIAIQIARPPKSFRFKEAWKKTWTVVTLTDLGGGRTHLRVASLGYGTDPESKEMRKFFEAGNGSTLKLLQKEFESGRAVLGKQ